MTHPTTNTMLKVLTGAVVLCLLVQPLTGEAAAEPKSRAEPSRGRHSYLRPHPRKELEGKEEPSLTQRVARWFFSPVGSPELMPEVQERKPIQHGPPSTGYGPPPQPSDHGSPSNEYGPPKSSSHFRPPKILSLHESPPSPPPSRRGTSSRYGPPKPPSHNLGPPKSHHGPPSNQYGPPGPPRQFGPPAGIYGSPKLPSHLGPPSSQYGPPKPPSAYGPPKPPSAYGPPSGIHSPSIGHGPPPSSNYGPPTLNSPHRPPASPAIHGSAGHNKGRNCNPCNKVPWVPMPRNPGAGPSHVSSPGPGYLPSAPSSDYGAPPTPEGQYGPPPPPSSSGGHIDSSSSLLNIPGDQYGPPPSQPNNQYGPPVLPTPVDLYGPPPPAPSNQYGAPVNLSPPVNTNGPPSDLSHPGGAHQNYGPPPLPPQDEYGPPPLPQQSSVPSTLYGSPSEPVLSPSYLPAPPVHNAQQFNQQPSSVPQYLIPPNSAGNSGGYGQQHSEQQVPYSSNVGKDLEVIKSVTILSDSQPAAQHSVTENLSGDFVKDDQKSVNFHSDSHNWNQDQEGPLADDQIHLPSGDNQNSHSLSNQIHSTGQHGTKQTNDNDGLEVIKSVRISDFLSSVEYPLEVVQSPPYIDINPESAPNKEENTNHNQQGYGHSSESQGDIIVGKPIINDEFRNNYNDLQNNHGSTANTQSTQIKEELQNHLEVSSSSTSEQIGSSYSSHNISSVGIHSNNQGGDQRPSSTNQNVVNGPVELDHPPTNNDLKSEGNNLYTTGNTQDSVIRHEEHISQLHSNGSITSSHSHESVPNNFNTQHQAYIPTGAAESQRGKHSSVVVDIQPSIQTSAQGSSLIYQINGLNTPPPPYQHPFSSAPAQTSVFVSFQHAPPKPFHYPSQNQINQQLPPPAPFQNTFQHPPPPVYHNVYQPEPPITYLNPPREPFKTFNTVTKSPAVDYSSWTPTVDSFSSTSTWGSATTSAPHIAFRGENKGVSFSNSGLLPPPPPPPQQIGQSTNQQQKKPKQIQIIVPYTSSKDLIQFRFPNEHNGGLDTTGWSPIQSNKEPASNQGRNVPRPYNCSDIISDGSINSQAAWQEQFLQCNGQIGIVPQSIDTQDDYHQHEESRRVTAKAPLKEQQSTFSNRPLYTKTQPEFGEVQHILASNIRDLLRGEEEHKSPSDSVNLLNLQKNIDEWTALEYSKHKNLIQNEYTNKEDSRSTTAKTSIAPTLQHLLVPSKKIPEEYLTTTPITFDDFTENDNFFATAVPSSKQRNISSKSFDNSFYDHDASGSNTHTITATANVIPHNISNTEDRYKLKPQQRPSWKFFESNLVVPEPVTVATTTEPTTTEDFTEETTESTESTDQVSWDHLEVSISPITKEKVYVVTPFSTWPTSPTTQSPPLRYTSSGAYQPITRTTFYVTMPSPTPAPTSINDIIPFRNSFHSPAQINGITPLAFHSPRFLIRPTPLPSLHRLFTIRASDVSTSTEPDVKDTTENPTEENIIEDDSYPYTVDESADYPLTTPSPVNSSATKSRGSPSFFGLTDLPTYTPPNGARVHTYSGHSKVVTVVTAPTIVASKKRFTNYEDRTTTIAKASSTSTTTERAEVVSDIRRLRPERDSYLWNFPELLAPGDMLKEEDVAAVKGAVVELKKEKRS